MCSSSGARPNHCHLSFPQVSSSTHAASLVRLLALSVGWQELDNEAMPTDRRWSVTSVTMMENSTKIGRAHSETQEKPSEYQDLLSLLDDPLPVELLPTF